MSKLSPLDDVQSRIMMEECWSIKSECKNWFPAPIYEWVKRHSTILGVPDEYLALPLLVATAHLSHHSHVKINRMYKEPIIIYSIVAGRSGTNKSGSLSLIADIVEELKPDSIFDSGTIEGLAKSLEASPASQAFTNLKGTIERIRKVVHENHGIIDKHEIRKFQKNINVV